MPRGDKGELGKKKEIGMSNSVPLYQNTKTRTWKNNNRRGQHHGRATNGGAKVRVAKESSQNGKPVWSRQICITVAAVA